MRGPFSYRDEVLIALVLTRRRERPAGVGTHDEKGTGQ